MYTCMYVFISFLTGSSWIMIVFMLMFIYMYVSMYLCNCMTGLFGIILVEELLLMQVNGMKRFLTMRSQVAK